MERSPEIELDDFIESLNDERRLRYSEHSDIRELQSVARLLKGLHHSKDPKPEFTEHLYHKLCPEIKRKMKLQRTILPWAALVACLLAVVLIVSPWSNKAQDIVLAMEQSVQQIQNYHGTFEKISQSESGNSQVFQKVEIWSEGDTFAIRDDHGTMTVNNGERYWTMDPSRKEIVLLPVYLDTHDFDLRQEAKKAVTYPHRVVGQDTVAGRPANRIEISPPGGVPYFLWVDVGTHLPVQLQTAMQKAVQTTYTFLTFEPNTQIPKSIFSYNPPQDYKIIDNNLDKQVNTLSEAIKISGIKPLELGAPPKKIMANKNRVVLDYGDTVISESLANSPMVISPLAALGQASDGPLEILKDSLRWQQNGLEIKVQGVRFLELAKQLNKNLTIPQPGQGALHEPSVKVTVNLDVEKRNQQQVDAGSSPWQLDPLQVAFTFAAMKMSPNGINGQPPLDYSELKLTINTGTEGIVELQKGPVKTIYLKRLVRQDDTGIWTVIGYDAR